MKLFIQTGSCSIAPQIIANEAGVELEVVSIELANFGYGHSRDSKGGIFATAPALVIDEKRVLYETSVICVYLADKRPGAHLVPFEGAFERVRAMELLSFIACEIHQKFTNLVHPLINREAKDYFCAVIEKKLMLLDQKLAIGRSYLMGEHFGVADAYLFAIVPWVFHLEVEIAHLLHLQAYMDRLAIRPSVVKAMRDEGTYTTDWRMRRR